jgi:hypothetical protein
MTNQEIKRIIEILREAEEALLDIPLEWQEEAAERGYDTLYSADQLSCLADFIEDKKKSNIVGDFDTEKIEANIGQKIKVKAANKYRPATLLGYGFRTKDKALVIKARISSADLPWGTHAKLVDYYPMVLVRAIDKKHWKAD